MKVEVDVLSSPSLTVLMVSVDVKRHSEDDRNRAQELCERRGGHPELPVLKQHLKKKMTSAELRNCCVKVEVDVLSSPSLIVFMVSVDVKAIFNDEHIQSSGAV